MREYITPELQVAEPGQSPTHHPIQHVLIRAVDFLFPTLVFLDDVRELATHPIAENVCIRPGTREDVLEIQVEEREEITRKFNGVRHKSS